MFLLILQKNLKVNSIQAKYSNEFDNATSISEPKSQKIVQSSDQKQRLNTLSSSDLQFSSKPNFDQVDDSDNSLSFQLSDIPQVEFSSDDPEISRDFSSFAADLHPQLSQNSSSSEDEFNPREPKHPTQKCEFSFVPFELSPNRLNHPFRLKIPTKRKQHVHASIVNDIPSFVTFSPAPDFRTLFSLLKNHKSFNHSIPPGISIRCLINQTKSTFFNQPETLKLYDPNSLSLLLSATKYPTDSGAQYIIQCETETPQILGQLKALKEKRIFRFTLSRKKKPSIVVKYFGQNFYQKYRRCYVFYLKTKIDLTSTDPPCTLR